MSNRQVSGRIRSERLNKRCRTSAFINISGFAGRPLSRQYKGGEVYLLDTLITE